MFASSSSTSGAGVLSTSGASAAILEICNFTEGLFEFQDMRSYAFCEQSCKANPYTM